MEAVNKTFLNTLLKKHRNENASLISLLQQIQDKLGYLPKEVLQHVAGEMDIPVSKLFSIATFYNAFSLEPQGRHVVSVCHGTACHVKNAGNLGNTLGRKLKLPSGEGTTADRQFTVKKVRCLGCCSIAPVVKVNNTIHASVTQNKIENILKQYRKEKK